MLQNAVFCDFMDFYMSHILFVTNFIFSLADKRSSVRFLYSPLKIKELQNKIQIAQPQASVPRLLWYRQLCPVRDSFP